MRYSTLLSASALVSSSIAGYVVEDDYSVDNFFSMFDFFTEADPTNGLVDYVTDAIANASSLIDTTDGKIYMGVDHTTTLSNGAGRPSVRITSNKAYDSGLVILDLEHFPGGICGTWPAFWMVGPDWPTGGEIDILEGTNSQVGNQMTLHTASGCSITSSGAMSGSVSSTNCYAYATDDNEGCAIKDSEADSYSKLNENGGGVFATEIDPDNNKIQVWFFPRSSIPEDITSGNPDPTSWGNPKALFSGGCEVSNHFKNLNIVFDTTFCGDWAGNAWSSDETCSALASTCNDYVANNAAAFKDAYWSINSLKVYQVGTASPSSTAAPVYTSTQAVAPTIIPSIPLTSIIPSIPLTSIIPTPLIPGLSILPSVSIPLIDQQPDTASTPAASSEAAPTPITPAIPELSTPSAMTPVTPHTPLTPPYPAGNHSLGFATGTLATLYTGINRPVAVATTVYVTEWVDPTPAPTAAAAGVQSWQYGQSFPGNSQETPAANKVAHMLEHKRKIHGGWRS